MMKLLLFITVLLCFGTATHAQCVLTQTTLMYLDPYRCAAMMNMTKTSPKDAIKLMERDVAEMSAFHAPAGTRLDWAEEQPNGITIVSIRGDKFIAFTSEIKSYCK